MPVESNMDTNTVHATGDVDGICSGLVGLKYPFLAAISPKPLDGIDIWAEELEIVG